MMNNYIIFVTATLKNKLNGKKTKVSKPFASHVSVWYACQAFRRPHMDLCKLECKRIYSNGDMVEGA